MYSVQITFKEYFSNLGTVGSGYIEQENFKQLFNSYYVWRLIKNTLILNEYKFDVFLLLIVFANTLIINAFILVLFPLPIVFALSLNELRNGLFKKWTQTLTYAPHFISVVVVVGMMVAFLDPKTGLVNHVLDLFGKDSVPFLTSP